MTQDFMATYLQFSGWLLYQSSDTSLTLMNEDTLYRLDVRLIKSGLEISFSGPGIGSQCSTFEFSNEDGSSVFGEPIPVTTSEIRSSYQKDNVGRLLVSKESWSAARFTSAMPDWSAGAFTVTQEKVYRLQPFHGAEYAVVICGLQLAADFRGDNIALEYQYRLLSAAPASAVRHTIGQVVVTNSVNLVVDDRKEIEVRFSPRSIKLTISVPKDCSGRTAEYFFINTTQNFPAVFRLATQGVDLLPDKYSTKGNVFWLNLEGMNFTKPAELEFVLGS